MLAVLCEGEVLAGGRNWRKSRFRITARKLLSSRLGSWTSSLDTVLDFSVTAFNRIKHILCKRRDKLLLFDFEIPVLHLDEAKVCSLTEERASYKFCTAKGPKSVWDLVLGMFFRAKT